MKPRTFFLILCGAALACALINARSAHAETATSSAQQSSASQSVAQGTIEFSQTPEHTSETVHNVSAPILGAYASSFSQLNCGQTTQGGLAVAGFSGVFGSSKDSHSCVLEVAAAETAKQSTITADPVAQKALQQAAINMRCSISKEVYQAYIDAGIPCARKPEELQSRTDTQPESTRIASAH
jgi:hypothetical protein